jgi:hypothetical protein
MTKRNIVIDAQRTSSMLQSEALMYSIIALIAVAYVTLLPQNVYQVGDDLN